MSSLKLVTLGALIILLGACGYKAELVMPGDSEQTKTSQQKDEEKRNKNGTRGQ